MAERERIPALKSSLEARARPASAAASPAEAASEAAATSESASESSAKDDRAAPAASASTVVVLSVLLPPLDHVAAIPADVGHFLRLHAIVEGERPATCAFQCVLLALRATTLTPDRHPNNGYGKKDEGKENAEGCPYAVVRSRRVVLHRAVQPGASGR